MFSRLFRRKKPSAPKAGPPLCMLLLRSNEGFTPDRILAAWTEIFPTLPPPTRVQDDALGDDDSAAIILDCDGHHVFLAVMPVPIPPDEIASAAERSPLWRDEQGDLSAQRAHAIATVMHGGEDPIPATTALTRVVAAAAHAGDSIAIYWGAAGMVHGRDLFIDFARDAAEDTSLHALLWVNVHVSGRSEQGPFTLTTEGLARLGLRELEIIDASSIPLADLREWAADTISYLIDNGPVLLHGQTIGRSADEKWRIDHTTSAFRPGEPVVRIAIP